MIDTRIGFTITFSLLYLYYLSHLLNPQNIGSYYFPNLTLFAFITTAGILLVLAAQEIDHHDVKYKHIWLWHLLGLLPPALAIWPVRYLIKQESEKQNDRLFILGLKLLQLIFVLLTILLTIIVGLIIIIEFDSQIFVVMINSSLGLIGVSMGYYLSKIRDTTSKIITPVQQLMGRIIGSKRGRVFLVLVLLFIQILLLFLDNFISFHPLG